LNRFNCASGNAHRMRCRLSVVCQWLWCAGPCCS
jgi:hypothetical protein